MPSWKIERTRERSTRLEMWNWVLMAGKDGETVEEERLWRRVKVETMSVICGLGLVINFSLDICVLTAHFCPMLQFLGF